MFWNALMKGNYKELKKILSVTPQMSEKQHWPSKICTLVTLVNLLKSHGSQFIIHIRYHVHIHASELAYYGYW